MNLPANTSWTDRSGGSDVSILQRILTGRNVKVTFILQTGRYISSIRSCVGRAPGIGDGQWKRVFPATAGTFDCSSDNLATIKMDLS